MFVDLGFADIGIEPNRIEIRGKRGGTVREGDAVKEVPPVSGAAGSAGWRTSLRLSARLSSRRFRSRREAAMPVAGRLRGVRSR